MGYSGARADPGSQGLPVLRKTVVPTIFVALVQKFFQLNFES